MHGQNNAPRQKPAVLSRRAFLSGSSAGATLLSSTGAFAQRVRWTAHGHVFEDRSGTGLRHAHDRGVTGVMVSNGRDVALTDRRGRWSLPVRDGDQVFVIKPRNWSVPSHHGLPRCAVTADARDQRPIEFALERRPEAEAFDVLLFADTQPGTPQELDFVRREMTAAAHAHPAAFAIHHGDVLCDDLGLIPGYRAALAETGLVWHHCPGNHDADRADADPRVAFQTWRREIGPTHYAVQHGRAIFFFLNNVAFLPAWERVPDGRRYRGQVGAVQLAFVRNVLRHVPRDHLVVLSMHIPLTNFENPASAADSTADRKALLALLSDRPHTVSFAGHSHTTEHHYLGRRDGFHGRSAHHHHILTAACGSWWSGPPDRNGMPIAHSRDGSPKGFHVLQVRGNRYVTRYEPLGSDQPERVMRIQAGLDRLSNAPRNRLLVNVFDAGPRSRVLVEFEGSGQPMIELARTAVSDPFIVEAYARHPSPDKPWIAPAVSSHIWSADVPDSLASGPWRIKVCVTGEYGQLMTRAHDLAV